MKKSRFTESQIVAILKELDAGTLATELGRKHGIHANTIRLWRDRYAGLESSDLVRLKQLEEDSRRKDRVIARLTLEVDAMKDLVEKKAGALAAGSRGESASDLGRLGQQSLRVDRVHSQQSLLLPSAKRRRAIEGKAARARCRAPAWGWRRLLILLRRERVSAGEHRMRRVYRELGLQVRPRKKRKVRYVRGNAITPVNGPNQRWSLDFMHDTLASGRALRTLMIIYDFTRECLAIKVERGFSSRRVIRVLEALAFESGLPITLRFDNGAELTSHAMLRWGAEKQVELHFIDPGKPVQNAHIESFNGRARDEFLNLHSFLTLAQAREAAVDWMIDYNEVRPHSSIGYRTPKEFAAEFATNNPSQLSAA